MKSPFLTPHRTFFFLLLLFLPTQLGKHFWPDWTLVLGRRVDYLSPTLFVTDCLLIGLLFSWLITKRSHFSLTFLKNHFSPLPFLAISLLLIFTTIPAKSLTAAVLGWITYGKIFFLAFYIYKTKPSSKDIVLPLSFAAILSFLLSLFQLLHHGSLNGIFWFLGERSYSLTTPNIAKSNLCLPFFTSCFEYLRPYATFSHPNVLGGFFGLVILLLFINKSKNSLMEKIALVVSLLGITLTLSRSAWIALILSLIFLLKLKHSLLKPLLVGITVIGFFFLLSPFTPLSKTHSSSWITGFADQNESIQVRSQLNLAAVQMMIHHPWLGVGTHNFLLALPSYLPMRTIYFLQPVHNIYLLLLSEWGIFGIFFFLVSLFFFLKDHHHRFSTPNSLRPLLLLFFIAIVSLFDHYFLTLQQGQLLLGIALGISLL